MWVDRKLKRTLIFQSLIENSVDKLKKYIRDCFI
jgi:hypothetical protein